jgi:cell division protein FtsB
MFDFHQKRKIQSILYSKPFLVFLCLPVLFFVYVAWKAYATAEETSARRTELVAELGRLEERQKHLEEDIANLDDPRGVEAALRKRYEVGKAGEELIVLVEEAPPTPPQTLVPEEKGWWDTVKGWF